MGVSPGCRQTLAAREVPGGIGGLADYRVSELQGSAYRVDGGRPV